MSKPRPSAVRSLPLLRVGGFVLALAGGTAIVSPVVVRVVVASAGDAASGFAAGLPQRLRTDVPAGRDAAAPPEEAPVEACSAAPPAPPATVAAVPRTDRESPPRGLLVRQRSVLAAIGRGARPSGVWTPATEATPAGLRLVGVPAPFRDGDLLLSVGGTGATSEDAIVSAVLGAVKHGARAISGEIFRDGARVPFAVEVPSRFWRPDDDRADPPARESPRRRTKAARR